MNARNPDYTGPAGPADPAEYAAEAPVNMRRQRLHSTRPSDAASRSGGGLRAVSDPAAGIQPVTTGMTPPARPSAPAPAAPVTSSAISDLVAAVSAHKAQWGLRGRVNAALGLQLRPPASGDEVAYRVNATRVQQTIAGTATVAVINVKGGQGKTPTTLMLASIFGRNRGGGVVAWDANESKGTLAERAAAAAPAGRDTCVWDLLEHADTLAAGTTAAGALGAFLRKQPTTEEVLASDNSSTRPRAIGAAECATVMSVLRRHRSLVVVDTGNDDLAENWRWVTSHADVLVVPLTIRRDAAATVTQMLRGLSARGLDELVATAVVAIAATPESSAGDRAAIIADLQAAGIRRVFEMPYEPAFASGDRIVPEQLSQSTTSAYTALAAEVADTIAALDSDYDAGEIPTPIQRPVDPYEPAGPAEWPAAIGPVEPAATSYGEAARGGADAVTEQLPPVQTPLTGYSEHPEPSYSEPVYAEPPVAPLPGGRPPSGGPSRRRWAVIALAGLVVLAALVGVIGWAVSGDDSAPAPRPASSGDPISGGGQAGAATASGDCPSTSSGPVTTGRDRGDTTSGPQVIKAFDYAYYVERNGAAARSFATPDAGIGSADQLDAAISRTPPGTTHCLEIRDQGSGLYAVRLTETPPGGGEPTVIDQLVQTTSTGGKTLITAIPKNTTISGPGN